MTCSSKQQANAEVEDKVSASVPKLAIKLKVFMGRRKIIREYENTHSSNTQPRYYDAQLFLSQSPGHWFYSNP